MLVLYRQEVGDWRHRTPKSGDFGERKSGLTVGDRKFRSRTHFTIAKDRLTY
jgi:hypothetical protein